MGGRKGRKIGSGDRMMVVGIGSQDDWWFLGSIGSGDDGWLALDDPKAIIPGKNRLMVEL